MGRFSTCMHCSMFEQISAFLFAQIFVFFYFETLKILSLASSDTQCLILTIQSFNCAATRSSAMYLMTAEFPSHLCPLLPLNSGIMLPPCYLLDSIPVQM